MPSLPALLREYAPLLVIDAASTQVQVGIFGADGTNRWATQTEEAGIAVFRCVERLGVDLSTIRAFVFCEGPGSTLGIRTVAMAIRTWQTLAPRPAFAYSSLALIAHALAQPEINIIADARRDSWHVQKIGGALHRLTTSELSGPLVTPENFRHWTPLPARATLTPYDAATLLSLTQKAELFRATDAPDAFLHQEPSYATWTPRIHRAPLP
ncbi:MAG: peptidase M22 [Undibacterium sp.]|nr:peptidase M22 [Opitutaceae bacterium]